MATYEIPLQPNAQTLSVQLAQVNYNLTILWRESALGGWFLDIADNANVPIISGIPLVTGADMMAQYGYLGLGFALYCQTDYDLTAPPTYSNLGATAHLYAVF